MTSFCLKIIAVAAMTIHHLSMGIGQAGLMALFPEMSMRASYQIIQFADEVSRIAFPLFAFMIAEGASKTRSMPKYIGRLALFAVISEPVYYFAFSPLDRTLEGFLNSLMRCNLTNVLFTLTLGAIGIYCYQILGCGKKKQRLLLFVPAVALTVLVGLYFNCNYGMEGIALILVLYLIKEKKYKILTVIVWSFWMYIFVQSGYGSYWRQVSGYNVWEFVYGALSCVFIWLYNGERGKPLKWSFYVYYPVHLMIIALFSTAIQ